MVRLGGNKNTRVGVLLSDSTFILFRQHTMSLELIQKLDQLVPNPSCVYHTLAPILHSCETPENIEERTRLSVGLSLCEFSAAHVEYPIICIDPDQLTACTMQLESKATWWTTFSGNYRHISTICNEYRPQFEAEKVKNTFRSASELFNTYQHEVSTFAQDLSMQRQKANDLWSKSAIELSEKLYTSLGQIKQFQSDFDQYISTRRDELINISGLADGTILKLSGMSNQISSIEERSEVFSAFFSKYEMRMLELLKANSNSTEALSVAATQTERILLKSGKVLESYNSIITLFAKLILILVNFSWPLLALVLITLSYWYCKSRRPRNSIPPPPKSEKEIFMLCDPFFY